MFRTSALTKGNHTTRKLKWWHILLGVAALILVVITAFFCNVSGRLHTNQSYASNWNALNSQTANGQAVTNSQLDNENFNNIEQQNYPIIKVAQRDPDIENILLIGADGGDPGQNIGHRSDSMIVMSINTRNNSLKMASVMRDIKAYFPDRRSWTKINAAYAYGGAGQAVNIINYNFGLDIQKYVTVNFAGFKNIINTVGGVTINVQKKEVPYIHGIQGAGTQVLNGSEALDYARIRHADSDFVRVQRQRTVIVSIYNRFKGAGIATKAATANTCINYVKTNIDNTELLGKLLNFTSLINGNIQQYTVPAEGMYTSVSSPIFYLNLDWARQKAALSQFIYGK